MTMTMNIVDFCRRASKYTYENECEEWDNADPIMKELDEICEMFGDFKITINQEYNYIVNVVRILGEQRKMIISRMEELLLIGDRNRQNLLRHHSTINEEYNTAAEALRERFQKESDTVHKQSQSRARHNKNADELYSVSDLVTQREKFNNASTDYAFISKKITTIQPGEMMSEIRNKFVPLYLNRYKKINIFYNDENYDDEDDDNNYKGKFIASIMQDIERYRW